MMSYRLDQYVPWESGGKVVAFFGVLVDDRGEPVSADIIYLKSAPSELTALAIKQVEGQLRLDLGEKFLAAISNGIARNTRAGARAARSLRMLAKYLNKNKLKKAMPVISQASMAFDLFMTLIAQLKTSPYRSLHNSIEERYLPDVTILTREV